MAFDPVEIAFIQAVDVENNYESYMENLETQSISEGDYINRLYHLV